ncbi:MAG: sulfatase-like hydrolase/transferase, partial [Candidatus Nanohaloarchaea archaeon]
MSEERNHKNVVLLVVDTLRAKNLPCYGYEKDTAPFLSKMAEKGVKLENYYSTSPWTVPAHASLFTGELPSEHGSTTQNMYFNGRNKLVEELSRQGYNTYGISENELLNPNLGFGLDFDNFYPTPVLSDAETWNEVWEKDGAYDNRKEKWLDFGKKTALRGDLNSLKSFVKHLDRKFLKSEDYNPQGSQYSIKKAQKLLNREENSFLFLNLMPVHKDYTFNEEQREIFLSDISEEKISEVTSFESLPDYLKSGGYSAEKLEILESAYDASIRYTDELIKNLVKNAPKDTLFLVIGDHGELFGEYEMEEIHLIDHHYGTYKELIQVPAIIFSKDREL